MQDNNNDILDAIKGHVDRIRKNVAQAIKDVDVPTLARYGGIGFIALLIVIALGVGVLALIGKSLGTLLGKIVSVPLVLLVIGLVYDGFLSGSRKAHIVERTAEALTRWAEQMYGYIRDSVYFVIQNMADRVSIIVKPHSHWDIEMKNRFFLQGDHVVFQFFVQMLAPMEKADFTRKLTDTLVKMHREGKLVGITSELVEINNLPYCPLQVLNVEPYDDGYVVQIVYADEDTITLVKREQQRQRKSPGKTLYDDEP